MKKEFIRLLFGGFILAILLVIHVNTSLANDSNEILLKSRHFIPQRGITTEARTKIEAISGRAHVLIQLEHLPTTDDINLLDSKGVKLLSYIPNKAWFASIPSDKTGEIASLSSVKAICEILPEDKVSPHIKAGEFLEMRVKDGKADFVVEFFEDVPLTEADEVIQRHNGRIVGRVPTLNAVVAVISIDESIDIAFEEGVKWVEQELPLEPLNNGTRSAIGVDTVQFPPYNLTGAGVNVLVYDVGLVDRNHRDLAGRVIWGEGDSYYINSHSTHVAGTVGGDGTLSGGIYRGMAPAVNIISYYYSCGDDPCTICLYDDSASISDMDANFNEGITMYGADIITASLGFQPTQYGDIYCDYEGDYSSHARYIDDIIYYRGIPITWAAANERSIIRNRPCGEYYTISPTATAKNAIVIGATNSNDNLMTSFSSWGPTDDGRIKPDIVAPGCENDPFSDRSDPNKTIWSTWPSQSYYGYCGTSMATPAVAGSVALMLEKWRNLHPGRPDPMPSTIKAVLIQTALDLGNIGPDYSYGYGRIDVNDAINLISDDTIWEQQSYPVHLNIVVPPNKPGLKITLAWDDRPAESLADKTLVRDLDLIVRDPNGTRYYPWVLDPSNPSAPAARGEDHTNNVEQICVDNPVSGTWTIDVNDEDTYEQSYSVVWGFPKFFSISKADDVPDGDSVLPGDTITYTINYRYLREPNVGDITDVNIVDYLPDDVSYVSSTPLGDYNNVFHAVTWNISTLEPNQSGFVTLTVKANECIPACGVIINCCEVKIGDLTLGWTCEHTPVYCAGGPRPAGGGEVALDVNKPPDINFVWYRGSFAADVNGHDVYFGTDLSDVIDADSSWPVAAGPNDPNVHKGRQTSTTYKARNLLPGETYYWRIDEVNPAGPDPCIWPGPVWAFTTGLFIDNFDVQSMGVIPPGQPAWPWKVARAGNALSQCRSDAATQNGAALPLVTTPGLSWDSVAKTMIYDFNNDWLATGHDGFAEARLDYGAAGCDWTIGDSNILSISYLGRADNDADPVYDRMYVMLEDADGHQGEIVKNDANAQQRTTWQEWQILLTDLNSPNDTQVVDMDRIRYLRLGFGDRCNMATLEGPRGGSGRVIFDNIRLKRCGLTAAADLNNDCVMDINDLEVLSEQWLICGICYAKADIYPPGRPDALVDFRDFAVLADKWLWSEMDQSFAGWPDTGGSSMAAETGESLALVDETSVATATVGEPAAVEEYTINAEAAETEPLTVEELVDWLDRIWQAGELGMSEEEYLWFRSVLQESAE